MEASPPPRAKANLRNRAWLLGLLVLAQRAGLRSIEKPQVHGLVFLANGLAPIYDDIGVDDRVIRHEYGPFYPDVQWDLDRLVGQGLLCVDAVGYRHLSRHWWQDARYTVTTPGLVLYEALDVIHDLHRSFRFLLELVHAFVSLQREVMDAAFLQDAIYRTPGKPHWAALVFERIEDNFAAQTAVAFDALAGEQITLSPKERLHLYLRYLGRLAARVQDKATA